MVEMRSASAIRESWALQRMRREPKASRSPCKERKLECSHHREHRPGWNCPSSSGQ